MKTTFLLFSLTLATLGQSTPVSSSALDPTIGRQALDSILSPTSLVSPEHLPDPHAFLIDERGDRDVEEEDSDSHQILSIPFGFPWCLSPLAHPGIARDARDLGHAFSEPMRSPLLRC